MVLLSIDLLMCHALLQYRQKTSFPYFFCQDCGKVYMVCSCKLQQAFPQGRNQQILLVHPFILFFTFENNKTFLLNLTCNQPSISHNQSLITGGPQRTDFKKSVLYSKFILVFADNCMKSTKYAYFIYRLTRHFNRYTCSSDG